MDGIQATMADLTGLMEYERYSVVVYAFTDKGRGAGSSPLMVLTSEHCQLDQTFAMLSAGHFEMIPVM